MTTNIFSVSVDSRQVSEEVKGLRAVLNKSFLPPTGRNLSFISRTTDDPVIQKKNEKLLAQHHENVINEWKLFRKIGVSLTAKVTMKNGHVQSLQQAMRAISSVNGDPLFTGVEKMGGTDTSLFTLHKNNLREGTRTLRVLPRVLQQVLTLDSYNSLGLGNPPQPEPKYIAMQQQENEYLDVLLNLEHCSEIDINKKRKG